MKMKRAYTKPPKDDKLDPDLIEVYVNGELIMATEDEKHTLSEILNDAEWVEDTDVIDFDLNITVNTKGNIL